MHASQITLYCTAFLTQYDMTKPVISGLVCRTLSEKMADR